jgi:hypothetical protein
MISPRCANASRSPSPWAGWATLDNAASESFFSTLEFECLRKHYFETKARARRVVANWMDGFYNRLGRHSFCQKRCPVEFEVILAERTAHEPEAA